MSHQVNSGQRTITPIRAICKPVSVDGLVEVGDWLMKQAKEHCPRWLLAHADDGVIWGRVTDAGTLVTSNDAARGNSQALTACPPLRVTTLQQARLFGDEAELLLWRDGDGAMKARLIRDLPADETATELDWDEAIDEVHLLWGTTPTSLAEGFTLWTHGRQGLRHAVPCVAAEGVQAPPQLKIRHYLARAELTRIECSRLLGLTEN